MAFLHRELTLWAVAPTILFTTQGRAQAASPTSPDAARLAAAHHVLAASGTMDAMVALMRANLPAQRAATPQLPAEFWTRFEARMIQDLPQLVDSIAVVYAARFTQQELEALVAFYNSPVGQRLRELQPTLVAESSAMGQRWGMRIGVEVGASLQSR